MTKVAIPLTALAICYVLFFGYVIASYNDLSARVSTHFNIEGRPNGWMNRETCVGFTLGLGILVPRSLWG